MGCYVRARSQCWEEAVVVVARNDLFQDFDSSRHFCAIFFKFYVVQVQIENVPIASIVTIWPNFVLGNISSFRISWWSIWLETFLVSQLDKFLPDFVGMRFQPRNPVEIGSFPPSFQAESRHQIRTPKLPWVILLRQSPPIYVHVEPLTNSFHILVVWLGDFVFDELFARKFLESRQVVLGKNRINFGPQSLPFWVFCLLFIWATFRWALLILTLVFFLLCFFTLCLLLWIGFDLFENFAFF